MIGSDKDDSANIDLKFMEYSFKSRKFIAHLYLKTGSGNSHPRSHFRR